MSTDRWLYLLSLDLDDLRLHLMEMSRGLVQPQPLGYGYKPGVSELGAVLKWLRDYADGTADYETGCNLLRDGNELYWQFVNARDLSRRLAGTR